MASTTAQNPLLGLRLPRPDKAVMLAVVAAAAVATALAYTGMVRFAVDVIGMQVREAYVLGGFLELSLVAVALMARRAAVDGRPYSVLLTLTWIISAASGTFAALHELAVPTSSTPYLVVFRFVPPLVAALMWHLALVGERHLVTGNSIDERRQERRVHRYMVAREAWRDARSDSDGSVRAQRRVRRAHARHRAARDAALRRMSVEEFSARMDVWVARFEAAEDHGARVDALAVSAMARGTTHTRTGRKAAKQQVNTDSSDRSEPGDASTATPHEAPEALATPLPEETDDSSLAAMPHERAHQAAALRDAGETVVDIARHFGVDRRTVYRWFDRVSATSHTSAAPRALTLDEA